VKVQIGESNGKYKKQQDLTPVQEAQTEDGILILPAAEFAGYLQAGNLF